jgi:D-alanine-D-alanine ligase-like ATP-grasp enzyme
MKIAVLHPSYEGSDSPFVDMDPPCDPSPYLAGHTVEHFQIHKARSVREVTEVARAGFDVVVNLCDGAWEEDRAGIEVVQALERLGVAFTGAGPAFYEPSREAMKMAAHAAGVPFPAYVMARDESGADRALAELRFPMIVKHPVGYSSVGLTPDSRVTDAGALRRQTRKTIEAFGGALIEEFIEGREYSVLVTEPRPGDEHAWALEPVEFTFPPGELFKHFELKWDRYEEIGTRGVDDRALAGLLQRSSALVFAALGGSGYARTDFRVDDSGVPYFLEINPNCAIFEPEGSYGSADFILERDPAGHRGFLEHILACALRRRDCSRRSWETRYRKGLGFGLYANRDLRAGETVEVYEERPQVLVSRGHVERHWNGSRRDWFPRYCWPLSQNVHGRWSDDPAGWRPINHSCDPNTWLEGLDIVARRDIAQGEELTIDYATFCGPAMAPFACQCGSPDCRGLVTGDDHLLPEIGERYAGRFSDFVEARRRERPFRIVTGPLGRMLIARRRWRCGEVVTPLSFDGRRSEPSRHTLQLADGEHAHPLPVELRYVEHSCDPNLLFDIDAGEVRALRDIAPGDPLAAFYPATEWIMSEPFDCYCDASACVGRIDGASRMAREILDRQTLAGVVLSRLGPGATR